MDQAKKLLSGKFHEDEDDDDDDDADYKPSNDCNATIHCA